MARKLKVTLSDEEDEFLASKLISSSQAWNRIIEHFKMLMVFVPVMTIVVAMAWKAYGEPTIKTIAKKEMAPILKDVKLNTVYVKDMKFTMAQILLILEKTTDKAVIKEVREETERFKPKFRETP